MLVQFMVKNVLSFKEETVLDMTAIKAYKEHECNLIDIGMKEKFLRVAAIYGANASGKSNLYMAMSLFQRIIMESLNNVGEGEKNAIDRYYVPFSFEKTSFSFPFFILGKTKMASSQGGVWVKNNPQHSKCGPQVCVIR